jgi:hypothetical protein
MANQIDGGKQNQGMVSGIDQEEQNLKGKLHRKKPSPGREDTLDDELERERLAPGQDTEGTGGAGADPAGHHEDSNSNS